jgi:tRNA dimethylallyltransferase
MKQNIAIITGPTASGKTAVSIEVAKRLQGEIISADSMQIYKYMDIGSAKPDENEMSGIPHHLIDVVYPHEDFSVAMFRTLAKEAINDITARGKLPIIVGGTGLYINSLTHNLDFTEISFDKSYREQLTRIANTKGNEHLHKMLENVDNESYNRLFPNDVKRVIRALEVYENTGKTISEYQRASKEKPIPYNLAYIGLTMDRQRLYDRINQRVDIMFDKGLVEEVIKLRALGYNKNMVSMQGIGYKEIYDYLDGHITLAKLKDIIKQGSRNYAKRQLTWFRRDDRIHWVNIDDYETISGIIENIVAYIEGKFETV